MKFRSNRNKQQSNKTAAPKSRIAAWERVSKAGKEYLSWIATILKSDADDMITEDKDGNFVVRGTLFENDFKKNDKHPDMTGAVSKPMEKQERRPDENEDDEIPF